MRVAVDDSPDLEPQTTVTAPAAARLPTFSELSPTARSAYPSRLKSAVARESPNMSA